MTDWIVLRFSEDLPHEYRAPHLDGLWIVADQVPEVEAFEEAERQAAGFSEPGDELLIEAVAYPTGRFETRTVEVTALWHIATDSSYEGDDMFVDQRAEVWEIRLRRAIDGV